MEIKKHPKADLEKFKSIFFQAGLVLTLIAIVVLFEWTSTAAEVDDLGQVQTQQIEEDIIPITRQDINTPPPPPQEQVADVIEIIDDKIKIDEELQVNLESDEDTQIEFQDIEVNDEEQVEEEVFFIVEDMPEFPGGELALRKHIAENVRYPEIAKENDIQGTVFIRFVVTSKGTVDKVEVLRGVDPLLDAEAIRVVKSLPQWKPGKQRGKPVNVSHSVPIKFQLQ